MGWVGIAMMALSAVRSIAAGQQAADDERSRAAFEANMARTTSERNAQAVEAQAAEDSRRMFENQARATSAARARSFASGIEITGAPTDYLNEMDRHYSAELDWKQKTASNEAAGIRWEGSSKAIMTEWAGQRKADAAEQAGWTSAMGTVGSFIAGGGGEGMFGGGGGGGTVGGPTSSFNLSGARPANYGLSLQRSGGFSNVGSSSDWWRS